MVQLEILCCGELTIDEISEAGSISGEGSLKLSSTGRFFGGRGGNASVYASMFGVSVGIMGAVGEEIGGQEYVKHLISEMVDVENLYYNKKAHTNKCFIFNGQEGSKIFFYGGALLEEREPYLEHLSSRIAKIEHRMLYSTSPDPEVNYILLKNSEAGIKCFGPSSNIYSYLKKEAEACLGNSDILFLNEDEGEFLERLLQKKMQEIIKEFNLKFIVKTLGHRGGEIIAEDSVLKIPPYEASGVIDTSGAGDAFAGAFMANYYKTEDLSYSGNIASATASFVVEQAGCQSRMPTREEIFERMKKRII
jgi:ribokinase